MKTDWRINGKQETHVPKWSPENNILLEFNKVYFSALYLHDYWVFSPLFLKKTNCDS